MRARVQPTPQTYIGHVLISVNPFRMLPIYTDDVLHSYRGKNRLEMPPHVYAIAESAYHAMVSYKENQCVIISGESGAGKTEAAKRIMQYIAAVASESAGTSGAAGGGGIGSIKDMVLATNPLLESFGNAKTLRNNNSSRFGKYLEIEFNAQGAPVGATVTNYLLEKVGTELLSGLPSHRCGLTVLLLQLAGPSRRPDRQRAKLPYLLPAHKGRVCRSERGARSIRTCVICIHGEVELSRRPGN